MVSVFFLGVLLVCVVGCVVHVVTETLIQLRRGKEEGEWYIHVE